MKSGNYKTVDNETISNYLKYICDGFLFYKASRYDLKGKEYLKTLFGDVNFYCKFKEVFINEGLAEKLISLLEDFLNKNYSLSFNNTIYCKCCQNSNYDSEHYNNVKIINSYINVLNYIKNDNICNNVNKIKIHGSEFGNLLPKLEFFINI